VRLGIIVQQSDPLTPGELYALIVCRAEAAVAIILNYL
jgi:hypothetical protein